MHPPSWMRLIFRYWHPWVFKFNLFYGDDAVAVLHWSSAEKWKHFFLVDPWHHLAILIMTLCHSNPIFPHAILDNRICGHLSTGRLVALQLKSIRIIHQEMSSRWRMWWPIRQADLWEGTLQITLPIKFTAIAYRKCERRNKMVILLLFYSLLLSRWVFASNYKQVVN